MTLKNWTIGSLAFLAVVTCAPAGSVNDRSHWTSIEKIRDAIRNPISLGGKVEMPKVDMKGTEINGREVPMHDLSTRPRLGVRGVETVEQNNVELKRREVSTYGTAMRATPVGNFTGKRAPMADKINTDASKLYSVDRAPIPSRRIVVATPEGLEELRKQLNRVP
jgi:hypothetical protein